ncbi:hypothetical protein F5X96DRAFT_685123 [Biscogniauxia mediterranea]|nr:hypothetical protein F5X96DRAFT_685123 [Biscogniauxia mediterranea]
MLFRPNATEFQSLRFSPSAKEFVPSNSRGSMFSASAKEFVPSQLAKEFKPSLTSPPVHQKSPPAVSSAPGSTKRFQFRPTGDHHFCYATFTYYSCGCRIKEPFLFCKPNFHTRSTTTAVTPGSNPCQHERVSIVVGCIPSACRGLHGTSAACMAPDPAAESFTREIDTANRFIIHFTLGNCRGPELQAAVPLNTNGGPSTLEDEVRQHYRNWQDPSAPKSVSHAIPVVNTREEIVPHDSEPVAQENQEGEKVQRNTEVEAVSQNSEDTEEAPDNKVEVLEDKEELVEENDEFSASEDEEQEAGGASLESSSAETDSGGEEEEVLVDSESIGSNDKPEESVFEPEETASKLENPTAEPETAVQPNEHVFKLEESAVEPEFAFESEELEVEPEESVFKPEESAVVPEEPVFEPEPSVEPEPVVGSEELVIESEEAVFKLEDLVSEPKEPTVEPEFVSKSEELEIELEETTVEQDPVVESEDPLLELERLMLELQEPAHEPIEFVEYPELHENAPEERVHELSDVELGSPLYEPEVSDTQLAGLDGTSELDLAELEELEGKVKEYTEDYAAQYSASSDPIDYGFDAYDGYDGSDDSDGSYDSDDSDSDDSDDSDDSNSEDHESGGAKIVPGQFNDRTASDMLDFLESCETTKNPETKPAKKFWSKLSFRVW